LQPDFGYLAEQFHLQPRGLVYELKPYPTNSFSGPLLTAAELAENEGFWKRAIETGVDPLARSIAEAEHPRPSLAQRLMEWAHVPRPLPGSVRALAFWYSSALDGWGVTLQRHERWRAATPCFAKAMELNPDNLPAQVNLQCNSNRLAGQELVLVRPKSVEEQFGKYRNWNQMLTADGPFDEPNYCYRLSLAYAQGMLWRQAGQQLERVQVLAPKEVYARLVLGELCNRCRMPDQALQVAAKIQADPSLQPLDPKVQVELAFLEAGAWFFKTNQAKAQGILQSLLDAHPGDPALLNRTKVAFTAFASYTNALRIADQQLQLTPDNIPALLDKGLLCLLAGEFSNAIPAFTRVLSLTNSYTGRINRGLAYLQTGQPDAAEADYQEVLRAFPTSYQPYYGLAEVARRKGDTNGAIRHYQQYLSKAPTNSAEAKAVAARLKELQPGAP
jgi:tetratricopeptide (TPR) repeat protein